MRVQVCRARQVRQRARVGSKVCEAFELDSCGLRLNVQSLIARIESAFGSDASGVQLGDDVIEIDYGAAEGGLSEDTLERLAPDAARSKAQLGVSAHRV